MPTKQIFLLTQCDVNFGNEDSEASMTLVQLSSALSSNNHLRPLATINRGESSFTGGRIRPPSSRRTTASKKARMSMSSESSESSESSSKEAEVLGCNCVKSSCLKLYCTCFQQGSYCFVTCSCANCLNTHENEGPSGIRTKTISEILQRRPNAFEKKKQSTDSQGCLCRKNKCIQLYCSCFANGSQCNKNCKCVECENVEVTEMKISMKATSKSSPIKTEQLLVSSDASSSSSSSSSYKEQKKPTGRLYKGAVKTKGEITGCKCAKTKCLKLYCPCFEKRIVCRDGCICSGCRNTAEESGPDGERTKCIEDVLSRRPLAFDKREGDSNDVGCVCKKTKCLKKYCICLSAGIKCDENKCRCVDCGNGSNGGNGGNGVGGGGDPVEKSAPNHESNQTMINTDQPVTPLLMIEDAPVLMTPPSLVIEDAPLIEILDVINMIAEV